VVSTIHQSLREGASSPGVSDKLAAARAARAAREEAPKEGRRGSSSTPSAPPLHSQRSQHDVTLFRQLRDELQGRG
jgi:hypothetical protein